MFLTNGKIVPKTLEFQCLIPGFLKCFQVSKDCYTKTSCFPQSNFLHGYLATKARNFNASRCILFEIFLFSILALKYLFLTQHDIEPPQNQKSKELSASALKNKKKREAKARNKKENEVLYAVLDGNKCVIIYRN